MVALISAEDLASLVEHIPGGVARLKGQDTEPVMAKPRLPLLLLYGSHRLKAAEQFLHPDDRW